MQFESNLEVTMKVAISSNNTQCVNLDIQDTHIQVNEIKIQLIETYVKLSFILLHQSKCMSEGPYCCPGGMLVTILHGAIRKCQES